MDGHDDTSERLRILHVTADPEFGEVFARKLPKEGEFEVISVSSVDEALAAIRGQDGIACIVSDHDLPDVDGVAFLETVRVQQPDLPFILFTSEGSERIASRAIHARLTDYLIKERVIDQWPRLASLIVRAIEFHRMRTSFDDPETRARVVLEAALDAMAIVQGDSFVYANEVALDLFGADDRETLAEVPPTELISPETRHLTHETFAAIQSGEKRVGRLEQVIVGLDGLVTPVELTAAAIDWRGEPSILLICRDVSDRKSRAREIERQNARLQEIRRLLTHQLRNPLAVARGRLELVREECASEHLGSVAEAIDRIASILEDTSTLAALDEAVTETERVPVTDLATHCWEMVETPDATLEIVDEMAIRGDPDRLFHLFENLFRNAVEHGGDDVTVRVGRFGENGLYVEDDGPGIPVDTRDTLLDPKRTSGTGTGGLGLPIAIWIAEAHGWLVSFPESRDGGARIEFTGVEFVR